MTNALVALSLVLVAHATNNAPCPVSEPAPGPGILDPFHVPLAAAAQQNADGKLLYRQGRWEDARQRYRAALSIDPDFLAPALNVACSFVRQERFTEAMKEVLRLIDQAYLPWSHEVLSAADLGALKIRAEGKQLQTALDAARLRWAEGVSGDLILVARIRAPLNLGGLPRDAGAASGPTVPQALVLGQRQEVFAWSPWTRRYRQLTAEDGRVLAVARSADGRRIGYLTAEKLIRDAAGETALRGLVVREMDLGTLVPIGHAAVQGDVRRVEILDTGSGFAYRIERNTGDLTTFAVSTGGLAPRPPVRPARVAATLTGAGARGDGSATAVDPLCGGYARDVQALRGTPPHVLVTGAGVHPVKLNIGGPHGSGLNGMPIP